MPKTVKKTAKKAVKTIKKTKKTTSVRAVVRPPQPTSSFSQEFTNALLVIFGAGMVLFAYVIIRLYA